MSTPDDSDTALERRALEIVDRVIDVDPASRSDRVRQECGADQRLLERVGRLLGRLESSVVFLDVADVEESPENPIAALLAVRPELRRLIEDVDEPAAGDAPADLDPRLSQDLPTEGDRYINREEVARGGMGTIFRVWDAVLRRRLAMKVRRARSSGSGSATPDSGGSSSAFGGDARFLEEAQVTSQLDHPGVVPLHDIGVDSSGRPFFTMRFVEGRDLAEVLRSAFEGGGEWTLTRAIDVLIRVCETLAYAHSKGVVHRDIKPQNIRVGQYGETYVMDWGLAKVLTGDPHASADATTAGDRVPGKQGSHCVDGETSTDSVTTVRDEDSSPEWTLDGTVVGTPSYMSPEQAEGRTEDIGYATDIYALGTLLYTLLAGKPPYVAGTGPSSPRRILTALRRGSPPALTRVAPGASAELAAICDKAMARRIEERYTSMEALRDDLRAWMENRVVTAHRTGAWTELRKWVQRNRAVALSSLAVLIVLAAGLVVSLVLLDRAEDQRVAKEHAYEDLTEASETTRLALQEKSAALEAETAALEAEKSALEQKDRAFETAESLRLAASSASVVGEDPALALLLAREAHARAPSRSTRDALLRALGDLRELQAMSAHYGEVVGVGFDEKRGRLVSTSRDASTRFWDLETGAEFIHLRGHTGGINGLLIDAPRDRLFTWGWDGTVRIESLVDGGHLRTLKGGGGIVQSLAIAPDGEQLMVVSWDGVARSWSLPEGGSKVLWSGPAGVPLGCGYSADGQRSFVACADRTARVFRVADGHQLRALQHGDAEMLAVRLDRSGGRLLTGGTDDVARLFDVDSGQELTSFKGHDDWVQALCWTQDETRIVTGSRDGSVRVWDTLSGEVIHVLDLHDAGVTALELFGDRRRGLSVSIDGTARIFDLEMGAELAVLRGHDAALTHASINAAGDRVVTGSTDSILRLWDARTRLRTEQTNRALAADISAWSDEGSRVVLPGKGAGMMVCDVESGAVIRELASLGSGVPVSRFSADMQRLITGSLDGLVKIWELDSDREPLVLRGHTDAVTCVALNADGSLAASGARDFRLEIWDVQSGQRLHTTRLASSFPISLEFSPDSSRLAAAAYKLGTITLFEPLSGERLLEISNAVPQPLRLMFSPQGELLFTGSQTHEVSAWNVGTGRRVHHLVDAGAPFSRVAFARDDRDRIATLHTDGSVRFWDLGRQECLAAVDGGMHPARAIELSADGDTVGVALADGSRRDWPVDAAEVARLRTPRRLLPEERQRYDLDGGADPRLRTLDEARRTFVRGLPAIERALRLPLERRTAEGFLLWQLARGFHRVEAARRALRVEARPSLRDAAVRDPSVRDALRRAILLFEEHAERPLVRDAKLDSYLRDMRRSHYPSVASPASADWLLDSVRTRQIIATNGDWRVHPGRTAPSEGLDWAQVDFDDTGWKRVSLPVDRGYSKKTAGSTEELDVTTVFARGRFEVRDTSDVERATLHLRVDDGYVVYLNGVEVAGQYSGPAGTIRSHDGRARKVSRRPRDVLHIALPVRHLAEGDNVLAVLVLDAGNGNWLLEAAATLVRRGFPESAEGKIEEACRQSQSAAEGEVLAYLRAAAAWIRGQPEESRALLEPLIESRSEDLYVASAWVRTLRALGRDEEARQFLRSDLDAARSRQLGSTAEDLRRLGYDLIMWRERPLSSYLRAARWAYRARELAGPLELLYLIAQSSARFRLGLAEDTLVNFEAALTQQAFLQGGKGWPRHLSFAALAYHATGDKARAEELFERILDPARSMPYRSEPWLLELAQELGRELPLEPHR